MRVVLILLSLLTSLLSCTSSPAGTAPSDDKARGANYRIVESRDFDTIRLHRLQIRMSLMSPPTRDNVEEAVRAAINNALADDEADAVQVLVYGSHLECRGAPDVAMATWGPGGRWAPRGPAQLAEGHDLLIEYRERASHASASTLALSKDPGLLECPLPEGATLLDSAPADLQTYSDPYEQYSIDASVEELSAFFQQELESAGWKQEGIFRERYLIYRKRDWMLGIYLDEQGGGFKLVGS